MSDLTDTWAVPFSPDDLDAAFAWASDNGLPLAIGVDHEGAEEVLEVPPRDGVGSGLVQFSIYVPTESGGYVVVEHEPYRTATFSGLLAALRLCLTQRGADWPGITDGEAYQH
jgi:hypothetical protein